MFSKSKINDPTPRTGDASRPSGMDKSLDAPKPGTPGVGEFKATTPKAKPPASLLSSDLHVTGNMKTTGDIEVEGAVEGDIRAHLLTIGESATIKGEVIADDVVINGRIVGRVRGLKVRLTSTARVEGDIIHKTIAIESGAHFEGSVQRQDDPLSGKSRLPLPPGASAASAQQPAPTQPASAAPASSSGSTPNKT